MITINTNYFISEDIISIDDTINITFGKRYITLPMINTNLDFYYKIVNDKGKETICYKSSFITLNEHRLNQLDKIL